MWTKVCSAFLAALAASLLVVGTARAEDEVHEGKVIAIGESSISVLDQADGDTDMFVVNANTKITYNGKPAKLGAIKMGDRAKVTAATEGGKIVAKEIAARSTE
jgi:hypothetical protein